MKGEREDKMYCEDSRKERVSVTFVRKSKGEVGWERREGGRERGTQRVRTTASSSSSPRERRVWTGDEGDRFY